ncbi:MAG: TIGR03016 family PEP-CTERM system-associated outer membrane protein [Herminiimonas sp.]|nr:TIGR03016 family PEP-CTERM system-associated outer membrane protein [Herminiimonas sp.]
MATTTTDAALRMRSRSPLAIAVGLVCSMRYPHVIAVLALPFALPHAQAADWTFKPGLELRQSYSDNVRLQTAGQEHADFVTEIVPNFSLTGVGRRLRVNANYAVDGLLYQRDSRLNNVLQTMQGDARAELVDDLLYFDAKASIAQQSINAFGPAITDNINAAVNRAEVRTLSLSPYVRHRFGNLASAEARYSHDTFDSDNQQIASAKIDRIAVTLNSGSGFRNLGWGITHSQQRNDYGNSPSVDISSSLASVRYAVTSTFAVTATAGYEKFGYVALTDRSEGGSGSIGFSWQPSSRTMVEASAGRRFFGDTYTLKATHRARRSVWTISYNEDITTTQSQAQTQTQARGGGISSAGFLNQLWTNSIPDAAVRRDAVDAFIRDSGLPPSLSSGTNSFSNRFFLQKNLQASVALNGIRNTVVLSAYNTRRTAQSGLNTGTTPFGLVGLLDESDNIRQTGIQGVWSSRLSPNTNVNLSGGLSKVQASTGSREDRVKSVSLALTHRFSPKLRGAVELRRMRQDSSLAGLDVRENAIAVSLSSTF